MEIIFNNHFLQKPKVSIILLDWSCRESYHILKYLQNQTIAREQFQIIWIEYYDRKPQKILDWLEESKDSDAPILDTWIIMGNSPDVYYHKHIMYNLGILFSQGDIVTICDSDAVVQETFIEAIIKFFNENNNAVLHMDQVRSIDKRFYPFNYPSIEQIVASE